MTTHSVCTGHIELTIARCELLTLVYVSADVVFLLIALRAGQTLETFVWRGGQMKGIREGEDKGNMKAQRPQSEGEILTRKVDALYSSRTRSDVLQTRTLLRVSTPDEGSEGQVLSRVIDQREEEVLRGGIWI